MVNWWLISTKQMLMLFIKQEGFNCRYYADQYPQEQNIVRNTPINEESLIILWPNIIKLSLWGTKFSIHWHGTKYCYILVYSLGVI